MIALLLLSICPHSHGVTTAQATTLEVNWVYDGGGLRFGQLIVWDGADCRDWRMLAKSGRPKYRWDTRQWEAEWIEDGQVVCVRAPFFRETFTQHDRETDEREYCPEAQRLRINRKPEDAFQVWNGR